MPNGTWHDHLQDCQNEGATAGAVKVVSRWLVVPTNRQLGGCTIWIAAPAGGRPPDWRPEGSVTERGTVRSFPPDMSAFRWTVVAPKAPSGACARIIARWRSSS